MLTRIILKPEFRSPINPDGIIDCEYDHFDGVFRYQGLIVPPELIESLVEYHSTGKTVYTGVPTKKEPLYVITETNAEPFDQRCDSCAYQTRCTLTQTRCPIIRQLYREIYY